jgi:hypothetical protein
MKTSKKKLLGMIKLFGIGKLFFATAMMGPMKTEVLPLPGTFWGISKPWD